MIDSDLQEEIISNENNQAKKLQNQVSQGIEEMEFEYVTENCDAIHCDLKKEQSQKNRENYAFELFKMCDPSNCEELDCVKLNKFLEDSLKSLEDKKLEFIDMAEKHINRMQAKMEFISKAFKENDEWAINCMLGNSTRLIEQYEEVNRLKEELKERQNEYIIKKGKAEEIKAFEIETNDLKKKIKEMEAKIQEKQPTIINAKEELAKENEEVEELELELKTSKSDTLKLEDLRINASRRLEELPYISTFKLEELREAVKILAMKKERTLKMMKENEELDAKILRMKQLNDQKRIEIQKKLAEHNEMMNSTNSNIKAFYELYDEYKKKIGEIQKKNEEEMTSEIESDHETSCQETEGNDTDQNQCIVN